MNETLLLLSWKNVTPKTVSFNLRLLIFRQEQGKSQTNFLVLNFSDPASDKKIVA